MAFTAVLDACVLYPFSLRDTLLRLAEAELYDARWSQRILDEVSRNLIANERLDAAQAIRLVETMQRAFPEASVPLDQVVQLEVAMPNDPGDRHVLAAAVATGAEVVVTTNLRHFTADACQSVGVTALHPDEFLCDLYALDPPVVCAAIRLQAADLDRPTVTVSELRSHLAVVVPGFAELLAQCAEPGQGPEPGTRPLRLVAPLPED